MHTAHLLTSQHSHGAAARAGGLPCLTSVKLQASCYAADLLASRAVAAGASALNPIKPYAPGRLHCN